MLYFNLSEFIVQYLLKNQLKMKVTSSVNYGNKATQGVDQKFKLSTNSSNLSTVDEKTQKSFILKSSDLKKKKEEKQKKDQGFMGYLNQKLHEWPIWVKLSSVFSDQKQNPNKTQTQKEQVKVKEQIPRWKKGFKINELPWVSPLFYSRCYMKSSYQYYHCEQNGITYFFEIRNVARDVRDKHEQIFEPPSEIKGMTCQMPTQTAKSLLQEYFNKLKQEKEKQRIREEQSKKYVR